MSRYVSFLIQSWQDHSNGAMRWRVCRVQDEEPISLPDASFVIRTWIDDDDQMIRGLIRHVQSGREMQFQSGERAEAFVRSWMDSVPPARMVSDLDDPETTRPVQSGRGKGEQLS